MDDRKVHGDPDRVRLWMYAWWALVGGLYGIGVIGLLTIGIFFIAAAAIVMLIGVSIGVLRNRSTLAVIGGLAVAPLYLAWLHRRGPGRVCRPISGGESCTEFLNPWPFAAIAVALVAGCFMVVRGSAPRPRSAPLR